MEGDGEVRRNRPRRRRPDQHGDRAAGERGDARRELRRAVVGERKLDVDRRRHVIRVFHFGFGQRRAAVNAPMDRLLALIDEALLDESPERPRDRRLILEVHRQVRVVPRPEDAEPLKLRRHRADEALCVCAARAAEVGDRHFAFLRSKLAIDFQLDRQPVTVVAHDVRRVVPGHRPRFDDEILENLVERRAQVNIAVGVGRAIVQDEFRRPGAARPDLPVEVHGRPAGERLGLARGQVGFHGKVGPRQVDGIFPLRHRYPSIL